MQSLKKGSNAAGKELGAFKKFISRGNVVDMAVGVIIGGAFGKIVTSLVNDVIMPLLGTFIGGMNFRDLSIMIGEAKIAYGDFIQSVVDFIIVAVSIFVVIRLFETFKKKESDKKDEEPAPVVKSDEAIILEEIRDLLKNKQ